MILHRVTAANVGPFVGAPVTAGPFAAGLNILSAPNETGKSTLLKAAGRALFDRHTCKAPEIRNLKPAGTQLAPTVTVEFVTKAGKFRVEKTFLQGPRSVLSEWRGTDNWQPVAEGDAADDRLNALLQSTKPGRGATDAAAHWGMLGYLWMRQGELAEWPAWERNSAGTTVQGMLVKVEIDPFVEAVKNRLWETYVENFTPSTGQPKAGGVLLSAETELARVEAELAKLARDRQQFEADEEDYRRLADELPRREAEGAGLQAEAERLRAAAADFAVRRADVENSQRAFESAQERLHASQSDVDALERLKREDREISEKVATAEMQVGRRRDEVDRARRHLHTSEDTREAASAALTTCQNWLRRSQFLVKSRRLAENIARLATALERCDLETAALGKLTARRSEIPEVKPAQLRRLEILSDTIRTDRTRVEALGLMVELLPDADATLAILADEGAHPVQTPLRAREAHHVRARSRLTLDLPGWGRIHVRSGAGEARALGDKLAVDETALKAELDELGAKDVETVRRFAEDGKILDAQIQAARQALDGALGKGMTPDGLRARLAGDRRQLQALEEEVRPTDEERLASSFDLDAAEQCAATQADERRQELDRQDQALKFQREQLGKVERSREDAERALLGLRVRAENLARQTTDIQARHSGGLDAAHKATVEAFYFAKIANQQAREKLPPDADALPERHRRANAAVEQVRAELSRQRDELGVLRGRLEFLGSQSIHTRASVLQAQRETLASQTAQVRVRSRAARLIHDLLERRQQAATLAVLAPLQERLGTRFAQVSGERDRQIFLDQSLTVRGLGRKDGELVPFAELSQGAKEQLLLCLRLAIAEELVARGEGAQSLVLDDVLVNTDADRQARVLDLLQDAAGRGLQILVCTCHPDRYRGVGEVVTLRREG